MENKPLNNQEAVKFQRIETFKNEIRSMIATSRDAFLKSNSKEINNRFRQDYKKKEIHDIVANGTAVERAELSKYFFSVSGLYKRIILHYATFLTYSWILVPHLKNYTDKISDKKHKKAYYDAVSFASSFDIEQKCAVIAEKVLVQGGYYGVLHEDGDKVVIQDLPFEYCRSRFKNQDDIDIVEFDVRFFDKIRDTSLLKQILQTYPKVIQKGYRSYKSGKDPWIYLPAEIGIYFVFFEEKPFFLDLIPLIDDLEDYKQIDKDRNLLSLKRIIAQEVPHDGMNLVFEPEEAAEMHEGVLEMLVDNPDVDVVTSYNKISLLDLSGDATERTEVSSAQQLIYDSAGVSKELFSATTDAGLQLSLNNDLAMMMVLGNKMAHFFTVLIDNRYGNKKLSFKLVILPISFYNSSEYTTRAKDLAAFGYSFLTPVLSTGVDQSTLTDLKNLENQVLEFEEVLKPLQSSYTQSSKTNAITAAASERAEQEAKQTEQNTNEEEEKIENQGGESDDQN